MKMTLEIPDDLYRQTKATAALRGESLKDFVTEALKVYLERQVPGQGGWRSVFGKARQEDVEAIDAITTTELERIDPDEWR